MKDQTIPIPAASRLVDKIEECILVCDSFTEPRHTIFKSFDKEQAAQLIDAEFRAEREEMVAALKTIKREARSRGEYNPLSGETRMSEGYQRIIELADSAIQRAEQAGAKGGT